MPVNVDDRGHASFNLFDVTQVFEKSPESWYESVFCEGADVVPNEFSFLEIIVFQDLAAIYSWFQFVVILGESSGCFVSQSFDTGGIQFRHKH